MTYRCRARHRIPPITLALCLALAASAPVSAGDLSFGTFVSSTAIGAGPVVGDLQQRHLAARAAAG